MVSTAHSYWLVGANWSGHDQAEAFYRRGYWEMGYDDDDKPDFATKRDQIRPGDRIALKSMDGRGATTITVRALGIVKEVHEGKVFVEWVLTGLDRTVDAGGAFKTIQGPYSTDGPRHEWVRDVFVL